MDKVMSNRLVVVVRASCTASAAGLGLHPDRAHRVLWVDAMGRDRCNDLYWIG